MEIIEHIEKERSLLPEYKKEAELKLVNHIKKRLMETITLNPFINEWIIDIILDQIKHLNREEIFQILSDFAEKQRLKVIIEHKYKYSSVYSACFSVLEDDKN